VLASDRARWRAEAACRGMDADIFHPARGDWSALAAAKHVCAACPVRAECLAYALEHSTLGGVWGGLSGKERRTLRRRTTAIGA
jgi:WhiB family redox-sensing transcriptional regulator